MKIIVRDRRNGDWYWISRQVYQKYACKIGAIGLAVYSAYASYAFDEQKVFPSQTTIAKRLRITRQTLIKYNTILEKEGLISIEKQDGKVNIVSLLRLEPVNVIDRGVKQIDRGCQTDLQVPVNVVDTNKNTTNKNKLTSPLNSKEVQMSALLGNLILERKPDCQDVLKAKKDGWQKWAAHVDRMIRLDKRLPERIEQVIRWCQADDSGKGGWKGWQNNILSTEKLRKQFDKLEMKMGGAADTVPLDPVCIAQRKDMLAKYDK